MSTAESALVFLPGLLCDAALFAPQVAHFEGRIPCRVADLARDTTIAGMAERVLEEAPPRFALVGLSMGGYVAFEIMRRAPERVSRLALLDTSARPDSESQRRRRKGLIQLSRHGRFKGVTPRLLPMLIHADRQGDPVLVQTIVDMAARIGQAAFVRQQEAILARQDARPVLPTIQCPTLVLCGAEDELTPPDRSEEIARAVPGAALTVLPECGHLATLEKPAEVNAALEAWMAR